MVDFLVTLVSASEDTKDIIGLLWERVDRVSGKKAD